jgi:hypothetical protein
MHAEKPSKLYKCPHVARPANFNDKLAGARRGGRLLIIEECMNESSWPISDFKFLCSLSS